MSVRAGILVTGTEVLAGRVRDRNGPWLSDRLAELGIDLAQVTIVGDRPADLRAALASMAAQGFDLVITSGGLGPTADDMTAEIVADTQGRKLVVDEALESRIADIVRPLAERYPKLDHQAIAAGNRKQATIPDGARVLEPVGTAPGLVLTPASGRAGPTIVALPGPPRELQPMWQQALRATELQAVIARATVYRQKVLRLFGIPESEIAQTLRAAQRDGVALELLEITTCLRGGEIEVVTRYEPDAQSAYDAFAAVIEQRHPDTLFSRDGSTVDEQVAGLLLGRSIAVAESCTGGMLAARLTDPPGASEYVLGGIVAYSDDVKVSEVGVDADLIERHGAVSEQVARALAEGVRTRLRSDVGVGITGIAGPSGGTEHKPVGLVWLSVAGPGGGLTRSVRLPGGRADVRERAGTVAMHLIRRVLCGESDDVGQQPAPQGPVRASG